jgi:hypothetical protein
MKTWRGWESSSKTNLVKAAITSIVDQLNRHVSTVCNAANSSVGQVEGNAIVASRRRRGKVSDNLLLSR